MDKAKFYSRSQAAKALGVNVKTLDGLVSLHNLTVWQIPGVKRRYMLRDEIDRLIESANKAAFKK